MTQPLTLLLYQKLLPGTQLVNRLQDLGYRVQSIAEPDELVAEAEREKPLFIVADLEPQQAAVCQAITNLRRNAATAHVPVIALVSVANASLQETARAAGATLVVHDNTILQHLEQFIAHALEVD